MFDIWFWCVITSTFRSLVQLRKNYSTDIHKICWKGGTWALEETVRFCW